MSIVKLRRILLVFFVTLIVGQPINAMAFDWKDAYHDAKWKSQWYDPCGADGAAAAGPTGSDTLDGHKLPAVKGGTAREAAINGNGQFLEDDTSESVTFTDTIKNAPADMKQAYQDYYITMRWRYALWNWNGSSTKGPEDIGWYSKGPRVLVTNPRTKKSIITVVAESGPAPWTGVDSSVNNNPKQGWKNPQDGTPPEYKGRVSGLPPKAMEALGAIMKTPTAGDDLTYAWAPDQKAKPGPVDAAAPAAAPATTATNPAACCLGAVSGGGDLSGADNIEKVFNFFVSKGFSKEQAAGILGNLKQESGVNPASDNPAAKGGGGGIAQWEGPRWSGPNGLLAFAKKAGKPWQDLGVQLNFIMFELENVEKRAMTMIKAAKTVKDAVIAWELGYERAGIPVLGNRLKYGEEIFKQYAGKISGTSSGGGGGAACPASGGNDQACQAGEAERTCAARICKAMLANPGFEPKDNNVRSDVQACADNKTIKSGNTCNKEIYLHPMLMFALNETMKKMKVRIRSIVTGHGGLNYCDEFLHPKGLATDIEGIDGNLSKANETKFAEEIVKYLPQTAARSGAILQAKKCFPANLPAIIAVNSDTCDHIHVSLGEPAPSKTK